MTKPGPSVTSGADTQPGSDSLFPSGFGGGSLIRAGGVGTSEIADGSVAAADLNLASVAAAIAARSELTGTYAGLLGERFRRAAAKAAANNSIELGVMATPPTITSGTVDQDATLTNKYRAATSNLLNNVAIRGAKTLGTLWFSTFQTAYSVTMPTGSGGNTPGNGSTNTYEWAVEFYSDAPKVQIRYAGSADTNGVQIEVDGYKVGANPIAYAGTGGTCYTLLDFTSAGGSKVRRFRFEMRQASAFDGIHVGPTYTVWAPNDENNVKVVTVGDSLDQSTGDTTPGGGWQKVAGKLLGWSDVRQVGFGGTGFVNAGSYNTFGAAQRIADVVAHGPDLLVIMASQNDDSQAGLQAAALSTLQAYRAALPRVPIIVAGSVAGSSGPSATRLATEAAVLAAFNQWADSLSWWIPNSNDPAGSWESGTGIVGATTGTGNRDRFGSDASHPNTLGHANIGQRFANAFRARVLLNL